MAESPLDSTARQLAALDLGSNSFHLIVANEQGERLQVVDRIKETVRLAEGLDDHRNIIPEVADRAIQCLERFGERLRHLPSSNVRVVGTNTLRKARHAKAFMARAEAALGHRIEIISGHEEARMIYLGVCQALGDSADRRLVMDIGGGSTELILGTQYEPRLMDSLHMGCVSLTRRCFRDGGIDAKRFSNAEALAAQELEPIGRSYRAEGWDTAIGASGTVLATQAVITSLDPNQQTITPDALADLRARLIATKKTSQIKLPELPANRADVYAGGLAILIATFRALDLTEMRVSQGALREGLLYDLLGRVHSEDMRERTVANLVERYHIEQGHGRRVRETARVLLGQLANKWSLTSPEHALTLGWAAELHEIGMDISHSQYHKHGGYLLQNMDMPGFSTEDQQQLAALVRSHRRKFPIEMPDFDGNPNLVRLVVILRIAVLLHRGRATEPLPHIGASCGASTMKLKIPSDWLARHPLTRLDLEQEADYLSSVNLRLTVDETG